MAMPLTDVVSGLVLLVAGVLVTANGSARFRPALTAHGVGLGFLVGTSVTTIPDPDVRVMFAVVTAVAGAGIMRSLVGGGSPVVGAVFGLVAALVGLVAGSVLGRRLGDRVVPLGTAAAGAYLIIAGLEFFRPEHGNELAAPIESLQHPFGLALIAVVFAIAMLGQLNNRPLRPPTLGRWPRLTGSGAAAHGPPIESVPRSSVVPGRLSHAGAAFGLICSPRRARFGPTRISPVCEPTKPAIRRRTPVELRIAVRGPDAGCLACAVARCRPC